MTTREQQSRKHRPTGRPPGRPRDLARRREVRRLLEQADPRTGRLRTFAEVGDLLGVSKQRVGQLAREMGIAGRTAEGGLRGRRRWFGQAQDAGDAEPEGGRA